MVRIAYQNNNNNHNWKEEREAPFGEVLNEWIAEGFRLVSLTEEGSVAMLTNDKEEWVMVRKLK